MAVRESLRRIGRRLRPPPLGSEPPVPPAKLVARVGGGDFLFVGQHHVEQFVSIGGLKPSDRVLDVGCGCGRMAVPLTRFLKDGSYEGFDIDERAVRWCREEITTRFPAFRFRLVDLRNSAYRPSGAGDAASFRFPYDDRVFDFIFLTSVFTHLLRPAQARYLSECARVLTRGGTLFASFFLLHDRNLELVRSGTTQIRFPVEIEGGARVKDAATPEEAIAFPESEVLARLEHLGFCLARPVEHGTWAGSAGITSQDLVIAQLAELPTIA